MRRLPPGVVALCGLLVVLLALIAFEVQGLALKPSPAPIAVSSSAAEAPAARNTGVVDSLTAQRVATILARPLFNPDRRPIEADGEETTSLARLTGVVVTADGKTAIFAGPPNGKPVVVREGARVGRYVVATIDDDGVTVIGPTGRRVLHPSFDLTPPPPTQVPAPGRPVQPPVPATLRK